MQDTRPGRSSALLLCCLAATSCGLTEADLKSVDLEGIWQTTVANEWQSTIRFSTDGTLEIVEADFIAESCARGTGTWSLSDNVLTVNLSFYGVSERSQVEVADLGGGSLLLTADGEEEIYVPVTTMTACPDYGWGRWEGTLSAEIAGVSEAFATNLEISIDLTSSFGYFQIFSWAQGPDSACGPSCPLADARLFLSASGPISEDVPGMPAGDYNVDGSPAALRFFVAQYWTDPSDAESFFEAEQSQSGSGGTFVLTLVASDRIVGNFSFTGISGTGDALSVTGGTVDLSYR